MNKYGLEKWKQLLQSLSEEARKIWNEPVLYVQEHPFALYKELISALSVESSTKEISELSSIYEYIADHSLNKLYKVFFSFAKPQFVIKNYPKLWQRFFNTGHVEVPVAESGHAILSFKLPELFLDWLEPACFGIQKRL
jgi:hypothetical protein